MSDRSPRTAAVLLVALGLFAGVPAPHADPASRRLTLAEAVAVAGGSSSASSLAALKEEEANARVGQARGALLPGLTGAAFASNRTFNLEALGFSFPTAPGQAPIDPLIGPVDEMDARLKVTQTLFDAASWVKLGAARRGVTQARNEGDASREGAAQAAALAYARAVRAQAQVAARQADLDIATELESLASAQQSAGTAPAIDETRARTQVAQARGALLMASNGLARTRIDLARALGIDPATPFELADSLSGDLGASSAPESSEAATAFALQKRPDLAGERARGAKAHADRSAISAERLPRIDAAADWGASGEHAGSALATRQVMVSVSVPLLDGFRREARIAEQGAVERESQVRERDLRDQIAADVSAALLDLSSGREQQQVAAERLRLAADELAQARERFVNGIAGNIEVINAQSSLIRAHDADIDARYATAVARIALARATGVARTLK